MRWDSIRDDASRDARPVLFEREAVARSFDTPGFRGITFFEVHARSIINKVPAASRVPFRWTINPYRGCTHACYYCFARNTHTYLDLDAGIDFNSKIIVKVNAAERARAELARPGWGGEHVAMGTNVDCYQRAEGRYRLMPGIIEALRDARNPFSILTKGTLLLRDLDLLEQAAEVTSVSLNMSVGFTDAGLSASVEPGTPSPQRRLDACAAINARGLRCGILMGPILPFLTDSPARLAGTVRDIAASGATSISPIVLHLRPGAREWYLRWLADRHPDLVPRYQRLYGSSAYAPAGYQQRISARVADLARTYGVGKAAPAAAPRPTDRTEQVAVPPWVPAVPGPAAAGPAAAGPAAAGPAVTGGPAAARGMQLSLL